MNENLKAMLVQVGGGAYLATTTWAGVVDITVKTLLGIAMTILAWHQIVALRQRKHHVDRLEALLRQSRIKCDKAANGLCWMEDEANKERDKGAKI